MATRIDWNRVKRVKAPLVRVYKRSEEGRKDSWRAEWDDPVLGRRIRKSLTSMGFQSTEEVIDWIREKSAELLSAKAKRSRPDAVEIEKQERSAVPLSQVVELYLSSCIAEKGEKSTQTTIRKLKPFREWLRSSGSRFDKGSVLSKVALTVFRDSLLASKKKTSAKNARRGAKQATTKSLSRATLNGYIRTTKAFLNWARRRDYLALSRDEISDALGQFKETKKRPTSLSPVELRRLLRSALSQDLELCFSSRNNKGAYYEEEQDPNAANKYKPLFAFAATLTLTGMRLEECAHLRWEDIDFVQGTILVTDDPEFSHAVKTGQERMLTLSDSPALLGLLRALKLQSEGSTYVFGGSTPYAFDRRSWYRVCDAAGLDRSKSTPQSLRRGFATAFALSGAGIFEHCGRLGHGTGVARKFYIASAKPLPGDTVEQWLGIEKLMKDAQSNLFRSQRTKLASA